MRSCRKLVSVVGGATTTTPITPFLSRCSLTSDSSFPRSVSSSVTTIQRNYATTRRTPPSTGDSSLQNNKKTDVFPSSSSSSWRRPPASASFLHHHPSLGRCYSSNKRVETGLMMDTSSASAASSSRSSSDGIPSSFGGNNTHNLECGGGGSDSSCSIPSPCSAITSNQTLFANTGGNCGGGSNDGSNKGPSSSISSSSSSAPGVGGMVSPTMTTTFGIASAGLASSFTPIRTVATSQRLVEVSRESNMEQPKLLSKEEREEFMSVYHGLVKDLLEIPDMKDMGETNRWMARVLQYNVPHGKRNRGLSTALAYKYFAPEELTEENVKLSYVLGWCVEILQAFFLVSDDIMDDSETRRGRPCWYKVDNLGLAAINDAIMLESVIYQILRKHFSGKSCYPKLMEVMHDVTYKTVFGQSLDTKTGQDRRMETYTMERYSSIVKYKTSYYSFYLPVALAMTLCDIKDPNLYQQVRKVTLEMGHFFQVQDDYLDCFGDEEVTGKIGTDIQDCKCSWLFVTAVQRCNPDQKKYLLANYGVNEPAKIEAVKGLYKELELEEVYHNYEEQTYNLICTHIQQMNVELPKGLFHDILHKIYKRSS